MPTTTLVLMVIGSLGILVSIVTFLYGLVNWEEESAFDRTAVGSFIIGQALFNAGIVYWLLI